jgi:hypothetical protein
LLEIEVEPIHKCVYLRKFVKIPIVINDLGGISSGNCIIMKPELFFDSVKSISDGDHIFSLGQTLFNRSFDYS